MAAVVTSADVAPARRLSGRWRLVVIAGLVIMVLGAVDPLEGSVVVLAGLALVTIGVHASRSRRRWLPWLSLGLMASGVAALWWLSALGGFGGDSGRSNAWGLLILPYPLGWLLGLAAAVMGLRERAPAESIPAP